MTFPDSITQFDGNFLIALQQALVTDWLTPIMKAITLLGEKGLFSIAICILLLCFRKTRRLGIICSLAVAVSFIICNLGLKPAFDRPRPWVTFNEITRLDTELHDSSFPSGHCNNMMAFAWAFWLGTRGRNPVGIDDSEADIRKLHRVGIALLILAFLMGLSRMYLGMHYPTDVLAGWLCGLLSASCVYLAYCKYLRKKGVICD